MPEDNNQYSSHADDRQESDKKNRRTTDYPLPKGCRFFHDSPWLCASAPLREMLPFSLTVPTNPRLVARPQAIRFADAATFLREQILPRARHVAPSGFSLCRGTRLAADAPAFRANTRQIFPNSLFHALPYIECRFLVVKRLLA
jgi:hypothetical protein